MNISQIVRQSLKNHVKFIFQSSHQYLTLQKQSNMSNSVVGQWWDDPNIYLILVYFMCIFMHLTLNQCQSFSKNLMGLKKILHFVVKHHSAIADIVVQL